MLWRRKNYWANADPTQKPPAQQQTPPLTITSSPKTTCYENELFLSQTAVSGGKGSSRTYSLSKPSWLKIGQDGLITGICPEVSKDSLVPVEWSVAEPGLTPAVQRFDLGDRNTSNSYIISPKSTENPLISVAENSLTFAKPVSYNVGDILGADTSQLTPYGLARKITSISDNRTRAGTITAPLEEIIKNGSFSIKGTLSPSSIIESFKGIEGVAFSSAAENGLRITLPNLEVFEGVVFNGYFELGTDFYFDANVRFVKLEYLDAGNKSTLTSDVTIGINLEKFIAETKEVPIGAPIYLPSITIPTPAGGLPVTITPKWGLYAGIKPINVNPLSLRIKHQSTLEMGVKYSNSKWDLYSDLSNNFDFSNPVISGDWNMEAYLTPKITFLVNGIIGASTGIKAGLVLKTTDNNWDFYARLAATMGISAEAFSHVFASYTKDIFTYDTLLAHGGKVIPSDTNSILFTSRRDGNGEIFIMNPDGSKQINLTNNPAWDTAPSWSPDRRKIAFVSDREENQQIFIIDVGGSNPIKITKNIYASTFPSSWSPDGSQIAFTRYFGGSDRDVYIMNIDGTNQVNLTNNLRSFYPSWSPDGNQIAFTGSDGGGHEIFVMNKDGLNKRKLTNNGYTQQDRWPAWSPDGTKITYSFNGDGNEEIYIMNSNGSQQINITKDSNTDDVYPSWSPDGKKIVYASRLKTDPYYDIWIMNVDGSGKTRLTNTPTIDDNNPRWSR